MFKLVGRTLRAAVPVAQQFTRQCHPRMTMATAGTCGIPPFQEPVKAKVPPPNSPQGTTRFKLPEHLIRPPCIPGSEPGPEQTCMLEDKGVYCVPNRIKYKYPSFSENMAAIPGDGKICWWFKASICSVNKEDQMFYEKPDVHVYK